MVYPSPNSILHCSSIENDTLTRDVSCNVASVARGRLLRHSQLLQAWKITHEYKTLHLITYLALAWNSRCEQGDQWKRWNVAETMAAMTEPRSASREQLLPIAKSPSWLKPSLSITACLVSTNLFSCSYYVIISHEDIIVLCCVLYCELQNKNDSKLHPL